MNCILDALKAGSQFPYSMLAAHYEECAEFWDWWWTQRTMEILERPYTIDDDDPILHSTEGSLLVDTVSHSAFFDQLLLNTIGQRLLPNGHALSRSLYQEALIELLASRTVLLQGRRVIIFSGGGYGAGKTSCLNFLAVNQQLPLGVSAMVGTDYFKLFLPEYARIKRVSDGRASSVVQNESKNLSAKLFDRLVDRGNSFIWDSSMSNKADTLQKITKALAKGYELELVAVSSGIEDAAYRAMIRAKEFRRFAHPDFLEKSHKDFSHSFPSYVSHFSKISLFHNGHGIRALNAQPLLIASKSGIDNDLEVYDSNALDRFLSLDEP